MAESFTFNQYFYGQSEDDRLKINLLEKLEVAQLKKIKPEGMQESKTLPDLTKECTKASHGPHELTEQNSHPMENSSKELLDGIYPEDHTRTDLASKLEESRFHKLPLDHSDHQENSSKDCHLNVEPQDKNDSNTTPDVKEQSTGILVEAPGPQYHAQNNSVKCGLLSEEINGKNQPADLTNENPEGLRNVTVEHDRDVANELFAGVRADVKKKYSIGDKDPSDEETELNEDDIDDFPGIYDSFGGYNQPFGGYNRPLGGYNRLTSEKAPIPKRIICSCGNTCYVCRLRRRVIEDAKKDGEVHPFEEYKSNSEQLKDDSSHVTETILLNNGIMCPLPWGPHLTRFVKEEDQASKNVHPCPRVDGFDTKKATASGICYVGGRQFQYQFFPDLKELMKKTETPKKPMKSFTPPLESPERNDVETGIFSDFGKDRIGYDKYCGYRTPSRERQIENPSEKNDQIDTSYSNLTENQTEIDAVADKNPKQDFQNDSPTADLVAKGLFCYSSPDLEPPFAGLDLHCSIELDLMNKFSNEMLFERKAKLNRDISEQLNNLGTESNTETKSVIKSEIKNDQIGNSHSNLTENQTEIDAVADMNPKQNFQNDAPTADLVAKGLFCYSSPEFPEPPGAGLDLHRSCTTMVCRFKLGLMKAKLNRDNSKQLNNLGTESNTETKSFSSEDSSSFEKSKHESDSDVYETNYPSQHGENFVLKPVHRSENREKEDDAFDRNNIEENGDEPHVINAVDKSALLGEKKEEFPDNEDRITSSNDEIRLIEGFHPELGVEYECLDSDTIGSPPNVISSSSSSPSAGNVNPPHRYVKISRNDVLSLRFNNSLELFLSLRDGLSRYSLSMIHNDDSFIAGCLRKCAIFAIDCLTMFVENMAEKVERDILFHEENLIKTT